MKLGHVGPLLLIIVLLCGVQCFVNGVEDGGVATKVDDVQRLISRAHGEQNADDADTPELSPKPDEAGNALASALENVSIPEASSNSTRMEQIADAIDQVLIKEFDEDTKLVQESVGKTFNESVGKEEARLETVVRISTQKQDEEAAPAGGARSGNGSDERTTGQRAAGDGAAEKSESLMPKMESAVDRIIDSKDNEFVLSNPRGQFATLTLDPQLIQDMTCILAAAAGMGWVFESMRQPVINGYLVAGALVGPGGLGLIKELVQIESLAQLGAQLLLFGLGLELTIQKLRQVAGVAVLGGTLQILSMVLIGAVVAAMLSAPVQQGVFVGALLSMSSTSVVVKCLEVTRMSSSPYGQVTLGTLILQDCSVGLMFALMPAFGRHTAARADGSSGSSMAAVFDMVARTLFKLAVMVVSAGLVSRTVLPGALRLLNRHASRELLQLSLIAFCLSVGWVCGEFGLSSELGAFIAGAMISMAEAVSTAPHGGNGGNGKGVSPSSPQHAALTAGVWDHSVAHSIESCQNLLAALFVASIGLIMSPRFLLQHIYILAAGTVAVMVLKTLVVGGVVHMFGLSWRLSLAVGISLAHIGEFSFVLLAMANQLKLLSSQVYMLLLGVTAVSLLTTPMVIMVCNKLLKQEVRSEPLRRMGTLSDLTDP